MEPRIVLSFLRLLGSILLEGLAGLLHIALFLLVRRRAERSRVRALMVGQASGRLAACGLVLVLLGAPGCGAPEGREPVRAGTAEGSSRTRWQSTLGKESYPGTSFEKQVRELELSAHALWSMPDAQESLEDDLRTFGSGTSLREAGSDLGHIAGSPEAQESLEDDLREFSEWKPGQIVETFRMLGW